MELVVVAIGVALLAAIGIFVYRSRRQINGENAAIERAVAAGVCIDDDGNIDAQASFEGMMLNEEATGNRFSGRQARFMELMRIVSEGPRTADEIRFLFEEGIDAVVRPDGVVYVPCIENEHLYMEGEIELREEDLEAYLESENFLSKPGESVTPTKH